ncbi:signal recognition particle-docking protein FtsY [Proteinivorax tanatarense]|uniref:Signal recognition particle receptor FtsY n=1 Tax=Proteinivorax tanatarense TaxID=1260629 RepID=A0AAU7VQ39_9FIRM
MSILNKFKSGLNKTRKNLLGGIEKVFSGFSSVDDEFFEELEEVLLEADVGVKTTMDLIEELRDYCEEENVKESAELQKFFEDRLIEQFGEGSTKLNSSDVKPTVIFVCGVNGVGKTTFIGKLTNKLQKEGNKVMLVAADTFRAAAIEQLKVWGDRNNVDVISHQMGSDPGAVIYDGLQAAKARKVDYVICDTAGRLHSKTNLMEELKKVNRVIKREIPDGPHESLLVLDATTGQNAINQAKAFGEATELSGIVLNKIDGTAKGGVVIAINKELKVPIKYVGLGEKIDDLQEFDGKQFIKALFDRG